MNSVEVNVKPPYSVLIERGLLKESGKLIKGVTAARKVLVVTDSSVYPLYFGAVKKSLGNEGFEVFEYQFKAGEQSKNISIYFEIIEVLAKSGFKRTDAVAALGGGVVGDIAGFAAATYMRGIDFVQIPTTLLAMIDSSVGGKTGVDLPQGKNLLGAFYQPKLVFADPNVLDTLPAREWSNGIGEGIKYACLAGGRIAEIMTEGLDKNNVNNLEEFISLCVAYKADVVASDEKESGRRKLLNLGHTLGHAIEKISGFEISHGRAVAMGIARMAYSAVRNGGLSTDEYEKIYAMLDRNGMGDTPPVTDEMLSAVRMDKKAVGKNEISVVVIKGIGNCEIVGTDFEKFADYLRR